MIQPVDLAKMVWDTLRGPQFDDHEEKLLKEKDAAWKGEVTLIDCLHPAILTHTNGDRECLRCHTIWKKKEE